MPIARDVLRRFLETVVVVLMVAMATLVISAVVARKLHWALTWYDEVASVMLAWLTYYGAALAALRGAHIGCPEIVALMPQRWRVAAAVFAEVCVIAFFALLAWVGFEVLWVLQGDNLVSLPWVPLMLTQSVIPLGAILFVLAELLHLPEALAAARRGHSAAHELETHGPVTVPADEPETLVQPRQAGGVR